MIDRSGQQLGNYRLIRLLGRGGFADVYLGEHIYLKTQVAIKILQAKVTGENDLESFLKEARIVAHLVNPHIVRVMDFGVSSMTPFLVMDYASHGTLRTRHPKGVPVPFTTVLPYVKQIAAALQYAHDEKVIHRDVKPENMLVGKDDEILLGDFGIALVAQSSRNQSIQDVTGTVAYMSPEQIQGKPCAASDQYALGIVIYEWLSGERPFHGSFTELCTQHLFAPPPTLREKLPTIALGVERIIMTALAKDPKQRFGSIGAFASAFEQACRTDESVVITPNPSKMPPALIQTAMPPQPRATPSLPHIASVWRLPGSVLLNLPQPQKLLPHEFDNAAAIAHMLRETLRSFRTYAEVREEDISIGPTLIRFGIRPTGKPEMKQDEKTDEMVPVRDSAGNVIYETRTRISRIMALQNDLALVLEAKAIHMEAPVPGRPYVGVEIPNKNSRLVTLREILESKEFLAASSKSKLALALGRDVAGRACVGDLAKMSHILIAGAAGSGKSVMINTLIASILTRATPDDVRLLMVDLKMVELNMYNGIPHLLSPVAIEVDKAILLLKNAISEMERRYRLFSLLNIRNLESYRKMRLERIALGDLSLNNMPSIVIIIDELADLMMAAPEEVEGMICRLAQLAHTTGIHLVVATQRPSVDVITGLIKANIRTRISFMVSSSVDSRTIIDMGGAERLLGHGDMLYRLADAGQPERIQGAFLSDDEAQKLADYWRQQIIEHAQALGEAAPAAEAQEKPGWELRAEPEDELELDDDLLDKAEEVVREYGRASISLLQRRLRVGYSRAARLIDLLEERGVIGHAETCGRAREVYDQGQASHQPQDEGQSLLDEADDIMDEERARNEFLCSEFLRRHKR